MSDRLSSVSDMSSSGSAVPVAISAAGVLAVLLVGRRSTSAAQRAVAAADRSADTAADALAVARESVAIAEQARRESERTRLDMAAPRLSLRDARVDRPLIGVASDYTSRAAPWPQFVPDVAEEGGRRLYIRGWVKMLNEGRSAASVTVPAHVYPNAPQSDFSASSVTVDLNPQAQALDLPPGGSIWLCLEAGRTLDEWTARDGTDNVEVPFRLESRDGYSDGILDVVTVTIAARPLLPRKPGSSLHELNPETALIRVSAIARSYGAGSPGE